MPSLLNLSGLLAALAGEDDLAEKDLRSAVESEPDHKSWVSYLAVFLAERGRLEEAVAVLDEGVTHVDNTDDLESMRARMAKEIEASR
jgi:Flp pilus assembly protein TadD